MATKDISEHLLTIMWIIFLIGVFIFTVIPMFNDADGRKDRLEYHSIDKVEIASIETLPDMLATDNFILGSGLVGSEIVYSYYIKNSDGGYVLQQVAASMSTIYMDENDKPHITKYYSETDRLKKQFVSSYAFHVPNGTIVKTYNVMGNINDSN